MRENAKKWYELAINTKYMTITTYPRMNTHIILPPSIRSVGNGPPWTISKS